MKRSSPVAFLLAVLGWAAGCATAPRPLVDPGYAARAFTPGRIAVLPPDVFVVLDQVGDNDPVQSAALGQAVSAETVRAIERSLRTRGYDVDLSATWDGIFGPDGAPLVSGAELGDLARGLVRFAGSADAGRQGVMAVPAQVAPDLAARVGWATQSDAVLYVNVKGVVTTPGRETATVLAAVFIVVIVAAIVVVLASQKGGGGGGHGLGGGGGGSHVSGGGMRAAPPVSAGGRPTGWHSAPVGGAAPRVHSPAAASAPSGAGPSFRPPVPAAAPSGLRPASMSAGASRAAAPPVGGVGAWRGGGRPPAPMRGGHVYVGPGFGVDVAVVVPIDEPVYTHDGSIAYDDPFFAGDELYVSMTLISTYDGRVLWHARNSLDLEANKPAEVERMVQLFLDTLPPALPPSPPAVAPAPPSPPAVPAP